MTPDARRQELFLVVYMTESNDLYASDVLRSYEAAKELVDSSNEKAIIIRAGSDCTAEPLLLDTEDWT